MRKLMLAVTLLLVVVAVAACDLTKPAPGDTPSTTGPQTSTTGQPSSPGPNSPTALPAASGSQANVAAIVNGTVIPLDAYQKQFFQFKVALTGQGMDLTSAEGQAALAQVRRQVIDSMIDQVLIEQAAAAANITVSDADVNKKVDEAIADGGGKDKFQTWLADNSMTEDEFVKMLRQQLIADQVVQAVTTSVKTKSEQVHARHILLKTEAEAQAVLEKVKKGEDFAKLAKQYSVDEMTKDQGGDLGWFPRGMLLIPAEVEGIVFSLQAGQVSGVVRSQFGYHILQVIERDASRVLTAEVLQNVKQDAFTRWLADQRSKATVDIKVTLD